MQVLFLKSNMVPNGQNLTRLIRWLPLSPIIKSDVVGSTAICPNELKRALVPIPSETPAIDPTIVDTVPFVSNFLKRLPPKKKTLKFTSTYTLRGELTVADMERPSIDDAIPVPAIVVTFPVGEIFLIR